MTFHRELRTAPRDCVVITSQPDVDRVAREQGRRCLLLGRDFRDYRDLRENWSELTKRVGMAQVVGPEWLCQAAENLCQTTHINTTTGARRSRRWVEHTLRNLPLLTHCPPALKCDALRGMPAFIVGAGPSLDKNADQLRRAMKKGVVIRVNSATAAPGQVALCIESNDIRHKLRVSRDIRIFGLACPPAVMQHGSGPLRPIWAGEISWVPELLTGTPRIPTSGSASTSAVALAHTWGCGPIVLVGQDMAMTGGRVYADLTGHGDDRYYASGRFEWGEASRSADRPLNPLTEQEPAEQARAWGGGRNVLCSMTQARVRHWMSAAADGLECTPYNCTEGGAHIPGWIDVPLERVLDGLHDRTDMHIPELAHRISAPLLPASTLAEWMATEAPDALAEAWAMPDVVEFLTQYRAKPPSRIGPLEKHRKLSAKTALLALRESARQDVEALCWEVAGV